MGKKNLDIDVYINEDYVYMSTEDWQKIVKVLSYISQNWLVREEKNGKMDILTLDDKVIH
jgi:hypothetical protein